MLKNKFKENELIKDINFKIEIKTNVRTYKTIAHSIEEFNKEISKIFKKINISVEVK